MKNKINILTQFKQCILSIVILCLYYTNKKLHLKIVNSTIWHNIYYKHTTKHKNDMKNTQNKVLELRKKIIGK